MSAVPPTVELPAPPSERRAWLLALGLLALGVAVLAAVLTGAIGGGRAPVAPPPVPAVAATPLAQDAGAVVGARVAGGVGAIVTRPSAAQQRADARRFSGATRVHIPRRWMEGFYPIYATAQATFGVNWLLISSIHMQETAFSTAPGTYHGLNFAHCCGGPMQFNVTNGPTTTWDEVADSYVYGARPAAYLHKAPTHPSIYDDFDSIMAGAHLLSADGAGYGLDGSAWNAAYDYYGHDATGVVYADQVLARAIGWSQHGFCINCGIEQRLLDAVHAAYGAPVLSALGPAAPAAPRAPAAKKPKASRAPAAGSRTATGRTRGTRAKPPAAGVR